MPHKGKDPKRVPWDALQGAREISDNFFLLFKALLQTSIRDDSIIVGAGGTPTFQTKNAEALSNTLRTASAIGRPEA